MHLVNLQLDLTIGFLSVILVKSWKHLEKLELETAALNNC